MAQGQMQMEPTVREVHGGERLLVVDDEPYMRDILSRWLRNGGYEVETAPSGERACELLGKGGFSLAISDIRMPGMSGIDLLVAARDISPGVAFVMATAVDDHATALYALKLGAYGYVIKPLDQKQVLIAAANGLERRRQAMESEAYERRLEAEVRERTEEIHRSHEEMVVLLMAAQEYRHDETGAHIRRLGLYAETFAEHLGQSREHSDTLRLAAPLHDIGKIGVPDSILLKPEKLTDAEYETIKEHAEIGALILKDATTSAATMARDIALSHHEHWDGGGYPYGLSGEDIPEVGRIVAILDVYDALVNERVYRPAIPEGQALDMMKSERGRHFEPRLLDCFLRIVPELRRIRERVVDGELPRYQQSDAPKDDAQPGDETAGGALRQAAGAAWPGQCSPWLPDNRSER